MPSHLLTNDEMEKYYQRKPKFNGVYSRSNLPKIKGGAYVINPDKHESIGTHGSYLYINEYNIVYFDSFRVSYSKRN